MYKNFFILYLQIKKSIDHFKVKHNEFLSRKSYIIIIIKKKNMYTRNNWKNKLDEFLLEEEEKKTFPHVLIL